MFEFIGKGIRAFEELVTDVGNGVIDIPSEIIKGYNDKQEEYERETEKGESEKTQSNKKDKETKQEVWK